MHLIVQFQCINCEFFILYFDNILLYNIDLCRRQIISENILAKERAYMSDFLKKAKKQIFLSSVELSRRRYSVLFYVATIFYYEFIMQLHVFGSVTWKIVFPLLFAVPGALLVVMLCNLFGRKVNIIISWIMLILLFVYYSTQLIYQYVFGSLLSLTSFKMGGDAITNFYSEVLHAIWVNMPMELLFLVPLVIFWLLRHSRTVSVRHTSRRFKVSSLIALVLAHTMCLGLLYVGGTGPASVANVYHSTDADTDISAKNLGLITTSRLELKNMLFGGGGSGTNIDSVDIDDYINSSQPTAPTIDTSPNVINGINPAELNGFTSDSDIQQLNNYFAAQSGTNKNEYTGYFKDKNLIVLCAESFSPYFIDEKITPTLYKMYTGGFVFNNYYNSFPNTTTNGEYALCMGLFPDLSRQKTDGSFKFSSDNYVPFCLGNMFTGIGVDTFAYHNYKASYYSRNTSHPNMGYSTFKTMGNGMKFTTSWPASDLEMMQQSIDDYINKDQFLAYYMTFSGHYRYDFDSNPMCRRNKSAVDNLNYSTSVKAYISCNLELEYALEYLMQRLTDAGKLNNTVIVLAADHYPYGLTENEYNELAGQEIDTTFGKYKSCFICYNAGMEPVQIDTPCCNIDILPTLLNLFGMEYDSRLIVGTDVLSTGNHIAVLANKSFITNQVMYDATTGNVTYLVDESKVADGYVDAMRQVVTNKMAVSTSILNNDYYRFVFKNTVGIKSRSGDQG